MKNIIHILTITSILASERFALAQEADDVIKPADPAEAAEVANRFHKDILQRLQKQLPDAAEGHPAVDVRVQNWFPPGGGTGSRPLVIRSSDPDPKDQAQLDEDMMVMAHLLEKAVDGKGSKRANTALGIDLFFKPGAAPSRSLYLEDYGAVFTLTVPFPLLPPAKVESDQEKPAPNSAWEQARREIYGIRGGGRVEAGPIEEYDQERVDGLKDALIEALKNASNIHGLKADEHITIAVVGGNSRGGVWAKSTANPSSKPQAFGGSFGRGSGGPAGSTLTLRVRKSDADAFARGKLSLDEFRKKVRWAAYASAPRAGEGVGAWGGGVQDYHLLTR